MKHTFAFIFAVLACLLFILAACKIPQCQAWGFVALSLVAVVLLWP